MRKTARAEKEDRMRHHRRWNKYVDEELEISKEQKDKLARLTENVIDGHRAQLQAEHAIEIAQLIQSTNKVIENL